MVATGERMTVVPAKAGIQAQQDMLDQRSAARWCWTLCALIAISLLAIFFYVLLPFLFPID